MTEPPVLKYSLSLSKIRKQITDVAFDVSVGQYYITDGAAGGPYNRVVVLNTTFSLVVVWGGASPLIASSVCSWWGLGMLQCANWLLRSSSKLPMLLQSIPGPEFGSSTHKILVSWSRTTPASSSMSGRSQH
jgi:hypothetical protein